MKDQLQTIREALEQTKQNTTHGQIAWNCKEALTALDQIEHTVGDVEPVGTLTVSYFRGCKSMENTNLQLHVDLPVGQHKLYVTQPAQQPQTEQARSICTGCRNADSWGMPDQPVCRSCKSGSEWTPLNRSSVNPNKQPQAEAAVQINHDPLYIFAMHNGVSYNQLCAAVKQALEKKEDKP